MIWQDFLNCIGKLSDLINKLRESNFDICDQQNITRFTHIWSVGYRNSCFYIEKWTFKVMYELSYWAVVTTKNAAQVYRQKDFNEWMLYFTDFDANFENLSSMLILLSSLQVWAIHEQHWKDFDPHPPLPHKFIT